MAEETIGRAGGPAADGCARLPAAVRRPGHLCAGRLTERHDMDLSPVTGEPLIENRTYDEITVGQTASTTHTLTREDIELFAIVSGDVNPAQLDPAYAETDLFHRIVAHGMWGGALISAVLGTQLPGPGTIYLSQALRFLAPVGIGDTITTRITVREKKPGTNHVVLDCQATNQAGETVITGTAEVQAPTEKIRRHRVELPEVRLMRHQRFRDLLAVAAGRPAVPMAVVHPCDAASLGAAAEVAGLGLVTPILVGPAGKIRAVAEQTGIDI